MMNPVSGSSQRQARRHSYIPSGSSGVDSLSVSPPAYPTTSSRRIRSSRRHSQQPLPAYAQAVALDLRSRPGGDGSRHGGPSLQQHEFYLVKAVGALDPTPWATLKVESRESSSSQMKIPRFFGGDSITGSFELNLDRPTTINSVTISLRGRFITGFLEEGSFAFLNQVVPIWDKNAGDPRMPHPSPLDFDGSKKTKFNAKLEGSYSWPFSIPFPTEIILPSRSGQKVVQTPQSFLERGVGANIQYQLVVHVTHGLFKPNSKLQVNIQYSPSFSPPPASFLRQQAYIQGGFLFPPSEDPTGWHSLPEARFQHGEYDLQLSLSLAEPLSYTRGTVIPCFLTLSNNTPTRHVDLPSLLLSTDPFFELQLERKITHVQDASQTGNSVVSGLGTKTVALRSTATPIGKALWWKPASAESEQSENVGHLEGEFHLPHELSPSCDIGFFALQYIVSLVPCSKPQASASISSPGRSNPSSSAQPLPPPKPTRILSCPIRITTFHVHGPLPTPFMMRPQRHDKDGRASALAKQESRSKIQIDDIFSRTHGHLRL